MSNKKNVTIISDTPQEQKKDNKKIIVPLAIIGGILVIGVAIFCIWNATRNVGYENSKAIMSKNGIEYSEQDYNKDVNAINNNNGNADSSQMSSAYNEAKKKNDVVLNNLYENTMVDVDTNNIISTIKDKVNQTKQYIDDSYGWPESKYGKEYDKAREYTRKLDQYACYKTPMDNPYEGGYSLDEQAKRLRYSTFNVVPYSVSNDPGNNDLYNLYFAAGHPYFSNIYSISLASESGTIGSQSYNLVANINTDNGNYTVYLQSQYYVGNGSYIVADIAKS